ncbi:hypothetical protein TWF694_008190 [Orbilia ellipsospora]|uniref:Uncharacterized protein n=1 Tax=Orbilia ellipsospora TaxID=2528407 RepID=A0AAV9XFB7_9PEZI
MYCFKFFALLCGAAAAQQVTTTITTTIYQTVQNTNVAVRQLQCDSLPMCNVALWFGMPPPPAITTASETCVIFYIHEIDNDGQQLTLSFEEDGRIVLAPEQPGTIKRADFQPGIYLPLRFDGDGRLRIVANNADSTMQNDAVFCRPISLPGSISGSFPELCMLMHGNIETFGPNDIAKGFNFNSGKLSLNIPYNISDPSIETKPADCTTASSSYKQGSIHSFKKVWKSSLDDDQKEDDSDSRPLYSLYLSINSFTVTPSGWTPVNLAPYEEEKLTTTILESLPATESALGTNEYEGSGNQYSPNYLEQAYYFVRFYRLNSFCSSLLEFDQTSITHATTWVWTVTSTFTFPLTTTTGIETITKYKSTTTKASTTVYTAATTAPSTNRQAPTQPFRTSRALATPDVLARIAKLFLQAACMEVIFEDPRGRPYEPPVEITSTKTTTSTIIVALRPTRYPATTTTSLSKTLTITAPTATVTFPYEGYLLLYVNDTFSVYLGGSPTEGFLSLKEGYLGISSFAVYDSIKDSYRLRLTNNNTDPFYLTIGNDPEDPVLLNDRMMWTRESEYEVDSREYVWLKRNATYWNLGFGFDVKENEGRDTLYACIVQERNIYLYYGKKGNKDKGLGRFGEEDCFDIPGLEGGDVWLLMVGNTDVADAMFD